MADKTVRPRVGFAVDGTDHFLQPIRFALSHKYALSTFKPRFVKLPVVGSSVNKVLLEVQFRRFLAKHDVVFFEWSGPLLVKASRLPRYCKIVTRLHSIEVATAAHLVDWSRVDAAIIVSTQMRKRLLQITQAPPSLLQVVNYGVDLERFCPSPRQFGHRIGMLARVVPIKRVYEMVLALYELKRQGHIFMLSIAGPLGDDKEPRYPWALREMIERLQLGECVRLLGPVTDPEAFYANIDIFVSNSFWEGQQNALLEAMASGCYCLSHCWGGAEEVLPPEQIFVTDSDLRRTLLEYAALSPDQQAERQRNMRRIAEERFDERRMIEELIEVIEAVI